MTRRTRKADRRRVSAKDDDMERCTRCLTRVVRGVVCDMPACPMQARKLPVEIVLHEWSVD